jgi:hypothetical protein
MTYQGDSSLYVLFFWNSIYIFYRNIDSNSRESSKKQIYF